MVHSRSVFSFIPNQESPQLLDIPHLLFRNNDRGSSGNAPTASSASMGDGPCLRRIPSGVIIEATGSRTVSNRRA